MTCVLKTPEGRPCTLAAGHADLCLAAGDPGTPENPIVLTPSRPPPTFSVEVEEEDDGSTAKNRPICPHLEWGTHPPIALRPSAGAEMAGALSFARTPHVLWDLRFLLEEFDKPHRMGDQLLTEMLSFLMMEEEAVEGPVPRWAQRLFRLLPNVPSVHEARRMLAWDPTLAPACAVSVLEGALPTIYKLLKDDEQQQQQQEEKGPTDKQLAREIQAALTAQGMPMRAPSLAPSAGETAPGGDSSQGDQPSDAQASQGGMGSSFGLSGHFDSVNGSIQEQIEAALNQLRANAPQMCKAIDQLGRLMDSMNAREIDPSETVVDDLTGIELGADLSRVLPSALQQLNHRLLRKVFIKNFVSRRLVQYQMEGKAPRRRRGGVIILVDVSASMAAEDGTGMSRVVRAGAAAALAVTRAAVQHRPVWLQPFDDQLYPMVQMNAWGVGMETLLSTLFSLEPAGGTDFNPPLQRSLKILQEEAKGKARRSMPDILLITDGVAYLSSKVLGHIRKMQEEEDLRVYAFSVGGGQTGALQSLCNQELDLDAVARGELVNAEIYR